MAIKVSRLRNKLWIAYLAAAVLGTAVWGVYLYRLLLTPEYLSKVTGPEEGYYWSVAQFQIATQRFESELLKYRLSGGHNQDELQARYMVFRSKYHILTDPSELTSFFDQIPKYRAAKAPLAAMMNTTEHIMARIPDRRAGLDQAIHAIEHNRDLVIDLANEVRTVEIHHRDMLLSDFYAKRTVIFISSLLLTLFFFSTIALLWNVTRRQQAALAKEREAVRAKNLFLGMISHEVRIPLQTIVTSAEFLDEDLTNNEESMLAVKRLANAAGRLERLFKDLTDYARLGAGKLELRLTEFDVGQLLREVVDEYAATVGGKGIEVVCSVPECPTWLRSDPERLRQIVGNLISNAIKYSDRGTIKVGYRCLDGARMSISVTDQGPGIPKEKIEAMFQPFEQLDGSRSRPHEGAGLGLAIVRGLVELMRGAIHLDSDVGHGTRVEVILPYESTENICRSGVSEPTPETTTPTILVVDDHEEILVSVQKVLDRLGYHTDTTLSADEAIRCVSDRRYSAILLDIHLPGKNGYAVLDHLLMHNGPNRTTPVIAMSAYERDRTEPRDKNFAEYLTKPVHRNTLRATLARLVPAKKETHAGQ